MDTRLRERGVVLPLVALCLAVLTGFVGIVVDVGYLQYQQRQQRNATDAAAISGATQLLHAGCSGQSAAQTAAYDDAASNGFSRGGNVAITVQNPPRTGPYAGDKCAVYVRITDTGVQTFLAPFFGYPQRIPESTAAVATRTANNKLRQVTLAQ
jgi:uncharacterized membrane protein